MADSVNDTSKNSALNHKQLPAQLLAWIEREEAQQHTQFTRILIAYSGGADSSALLFALSQIRTQLSRPLLAIHINHNLHPDADHWQDHCQQVCAQLELPLELIQVKIANSSRRGLEALAREARYSALAGLATNNDLLLTGQHADDQAETFLLHLLRGSGVDGLAAIHSIRPWKNGWLGRPLLSYTKKQLLEYLQYFQQTWIEDPSNSELQHRRNYLRHKVLPAITTEWPQAVAKINQAASHCQEAQKNLDELAQLDLQHLQTTSQDQQLERLPLTEFCQLPLRRQRLLLRNWIRLQGWQAPAMTKLNDFISQLRKARPDSSCELKWAQQRMAVHARFLYLNASIEAGIDHKSYPLGKQPEHLGKISFGSTTENLTTNYQITSRQGGETITLTGRDGSHTLKNIFQQAGIPPWLRRSIPLLWQQQQLIAIGDLWLADDFVQFLQQSTLKYSWTPASKPWQIFQNVILSTRSNK